MVYAIQQSSSHQRWAIWQLQNLDAGTTCQVLQHKWLHSRIHHQMNDNINDHYSRSSQGKGHSINGLQGIWGHVFQENPHQVTTLSTIWPCHQTQRLVCAPTSQGLPAESHQTSSLQRVHSKLCYSFLSKRNKQGNFAPVKTTGISIAIPSRTPISFPLSPTSSTNYKGHWSLSSSMYNGDITTSSSNKRTNGRQPSPLH